MSTELRGPIARGRTEIDLTRALVALIGERPWAEVTVSALCGRARVHRATFYAHFEGRDDLLVRGLSGLFDELAASSPEGMPARLQRLMTHCREHSAFYGAALTPGHPARLVLEDYLVRHSRTESEVPVSELAARAGAGALLATLAWFAATPRAEPYEAAEQLGRLLRQGWT